MKQLTFYAIMMLSLFAFSSCDKDGTPVETEMSEEHPIPTTDYTTIGYGYGTSFGAGALAIKDTVAVAYSSAERGFPFDSLTFCKKLTPALASCQWAAEQYTKASASDSTFGDWKAGFIKGFNEKTNGDERVMNLLLYKYQEVDMDNVSSKANIQKAFDMAIYLGGKQAKLVPQKVL